VVHKSNRLDTTTLTSFYLAGFEVGINCPIEKLGSSVSSIFALNDDEVAFAASNSVLNEIGPGDYWVATNTRLIQYRRGPRYQITTLQSFSAISFLIWEPFCNFRSV